jgi:hypothetical protein
MTTTSVEHKPAIVEAALDYFEGWFDGDASRIERALHPDLAKRSLDDDGAGVKHLTADVMIEATAAGRGKAFDVPDRGIEVDVVDVHGPIASATVRSAVYREYLQLVLTQDGWKIVNALWTRTDQQ